MESELVEHRISLSYSEPYEFLYHIEKLRRILRSFELYQGSKLIVDSTTQNEKIVWKNGINLEISWTSHLNSTLMDFRELGFTSHREFYQLEQEKRDQFLISHLEIFKTLFSQDLSILPQSEEIIVKAYDFYRKLRKDVLDLLAE